MKEELTVVTYNVLADAYVKPEYDPKVDPRLLDKKKRYPRITNRIIDLDADVYCLQEVDFELFERIRDRLETLGYSCRWAQKAGGDHDGCAIIVTNRWQILCTDILYYRDRKDASKKSGFVMQSMLIRKGWSVMGIVNTHLKWNRPDTPWEKHQGLKQATELCEHFAGAIVPHIVCGDMNAVPGSLVMGEFERFGYSIVHREYAPTFNSFHGDNEGVGMQIDHILVQGPTVVETFAPETTITPDTSLPNETEPSDHLPLKAKLLL